MTIQARLGGKYSRYEHGFGCVCHSPEFLRINDRLLKGISRRSALKGVVASLAAAPFTPPLAAAQPDRRPLLFTDMRVFDGHSDALLEGVNVLVSGNRIEALVPAGEAVGDARVISGAGRVMMPGLIDAHWHSIMAAIPQVVALTADITYVHYVAGEEAGRTLMRGFTTIRDVGGPSFALKRAIDEQIVMGPRIFPSGAMISQTSGHGDFRFRNEIPRSAQSGLSAAEAAGISAIADGDAEVLRRTREQLALGASQIKIMVGGGVSSLFDPIDSTQLRPEEIRAAVDAAADWGTYVCSHVYTSKGINRAIDNGVRSIEHGQLADEDTVRRMADTDTWWSLQPFLADEDANPKQLPEQREQQKMIAEGTMRAFELGQKHKANMAWGTDILFDPAKTSTQGKQLAKISRWFSNVDVLKMGTSRNAELLGLSGPRNPYPGKLGVIEAGALADLLIVDGNPLDNINLIADPETNFLMIMKDGRIYKDAMPA
ncbi:amidohydrolase family protein [Hoeflea sp. WL0058]|uniref:Amidohydrolase family protein n=1 Tax=Flavimaribacter sediminis TaxID=2865987 RepID=A0AAE3D338_9HYPH|nr:amidohydrolase family protein [Flavimaribacter sediminis]MBW8639727.1 amidohydrolase family protein [Flavimaribacter sediminis]